MILKKIFNNNLIIFLNFWNFIEIDISDTRQNK